MAATVAACSLASGAYAAGEDAFRATLSRAAKREASVLPVIRQTYLEQTVSMPWERGITRESVLASSILYGAYGMDSERDIVRALAQRKTVVTALEVLARVGSPASIGPVLAAVERFPDDEVVGHAVSFLMQSGGPQGRGKVLALPTRRLEQKSRERLAQLRPDVEAMNYALLREMIEVPSAPAVKPGEARSLLRRLAARETPAPDFNPQSLLDSDIPNTELIDSLERWRRSLYASADDDSLHAVDIVNVMINAVRYREEKK